MMNLKLVEAIVLPQKKKNVESKIKNTFIIHHKCMQAILKLLTSQ